MKVKIKKEYKQKEKEFYQIPEKERVNVIFWSCQDFDDDKEYEVICITTDGGYCIVDESGQTYVFPSQYFDVVDDSPCMEEIGGLGLMVRFAKDAPLTAKAVYEVQYIKDENLYVVKEEDDWYSYPMEHFAVVGWVEGGRWENDATALYAVGEYYVKKSNFFMAKAMFEKGAKMGDKRCQKTLEECLSKKREMLCVARADFKRHRSLAKKGFADAQFEVGCCYEYAYGVKQNMKKAIIWYEKSAKQRYRQALYNLAHCYDVGKGVSKDHDKAMAILDLVE